MADDAELAAAQKSIERCAPDRGVASPPGLTAEVDDVAVTYIDAVVPVEGSPNLDVWMAAVVAWDVQTHLVTKRQDKAYAGEYQRRN